MNPTGVGRLQCAPQPHGASGGRVRVRAVEAMRGGRGQEGRALMGWVVPGTGVAEAAVLRLKECVLRAMSF